MREMILFLRSLVAYNITPLVLFENFVDDIAGLLGCLGVFGLTSRNENGWASFPWVVFRPHIPTR